MKKLFIITDVNAKDNRHYLKDKMVGTVIRAEVTNDPEFQLMGNKLYINKLSWASGTTFQNTALWYDYPNSSYEPTFHLSIKVKPLQ